MGRRSSTNLLVAALFAALVPGLTACGGGGGNGGAAPAARAPSPIVAEGDGPHRTKAPPVDDDEGGGDVEIDGLKARLEPQQIEDGVRPHQKALSACYHGTARRARYLGGAVELAFAVGADGQVASVRIGKGDLGSWEVERCLLGVAGAMTFAAPSGRGEAEFTLPLDFTAGRAPVWWEEERTASEIEKRRAELDACDEGEGGGARDVAVTLYVGNRGQVKSVGFAAPGPIPEAWATCASAAIAAWTLSDPRGVVAKAAFHHRPE